MRSEPEQDEATNVRAGPSCTLGETPVPRTGHGREGERPMRPRTSRKNADNGVELRWWPGRACAADRAEIRPHTSSTPSLPNLCVADLRPVQRRPAGRRRATKLGRCQGRGADILNRASPCLRAYRGRIFVAALTQATRPGTPQDRGRESKPVEPQTCARSARPCRGYDLTNVTGSRRNTPGDRAAGDGSIRARA